MALYQTFAAAGGGHLVSYSVYNRIYTVGTDTTNKTYKEATTTYEKSWYALTYDAAKAQIDLNPQPTGYNAVNTWSLELGSRETGGYVVTQSYEETVTVEI